MRASGVPADSGPQNAGAKKGPGACPPLANGEVYPPVAGPNDEPNAPKGLLQNFCGWRVSAPATPGRLQRGRVQDDDEAEDGQDCTEQPAGERSACEFDGFSSCVLFYE